MKNSGVRFGIRSKMIFAFGSIIFLIALVSATAYVSFMSIDLRINELLGTYVEFAQLVGATENERLNLQILEKDFALYDRTQGDDSAFGGLDEARARIEIITENLNAIRMLEVDQAIRRNVNGLLEAMKAYDSALRQSVDLIRLRVRSDDGLAMRLRTAGDALEELFTNQGFNVRDIKVIRGLESTYLAGDASAAEELEAALQQMKDQLDRALTKGPVKDMIDEKYSAYAGALQALQINDGTIRQTRSTYESVLEQMQPVLLNFENSARLKSDAARREMAAQSRTTKIIILSITVCAVLLALFFAARLSRAVVRQIHHIMDLLEKISIGDYRARTPVTSNDELGMMAGSLNEMLDNIVMLIQTREDRDRMQAAVMKLLDDVSGFAEGDLTKQAEVTEDFTGAIADAFNMTIAQLREIIRRVQDSTNVVSSSAHQIYKTAEQIAHGNESGAMGVSTITAAIDEMAASIQAVSENSAQSADVAEKSLESARQGTRAVRATIEGMTRIRERVQETSKRIKRLGESSQEIGEIVQVINDLADRTSILALNASIQAAMAGEQGRGFAVVAEEVERLAQRSARATEQIASLVSAIQGETNETVVAMEETTREVVAGSRLSQDAGQALTRIEQISQQLAELIQSISLSSRQQARAADDAAISMNQISEITQQTADGTKDAAVSIRTLAILADDLRSSVSMFKLPKPDALTAAGEVEEIQT
jgi:twitching motility protein PilJ